MREKKQTTSEPVEMTYDEANERFNGEWVLMKLNDTSGDYGSRRGVVLAHSKSHKRIHDKLKEQPRPSQLPAGSPKFVYDMFAAYPHAHTGPEWRATIERASKLPDSKIPRL